MKEPITTEESGLFGGRLFRFHSLPSTNRWAMENIKSLRYGDVVQAISQTDGRGRFDRQWISPKNLGLAVSIILKAPECDKIFFSSISQFTALAVAATLAKSSIPAMVKWPNDVLVNGRKIAGILAERDSETGMIILGIGLNVNITAEDFNNTRLMQPATSMKIEANMEFDIPEILRTLILELENVAGMADENASSFLLSAWRQKDFLKGKKINVHTLEGVISGLYSGIDESGRLRLTDDTGTQHLFWSGDVSIREGLS